MRATDSEKLVMSLIRSTRRLHLRTWVRNKMMTTKWMWLVSMILSTKTFSISKRNFKKNLSIQKKEVIWQKTYVANLISKKTFISTSLNPKALNHSHSTSSMMKVILLILYRCLLREMIKIISTTPICRAGDLFREKMLPQRKQLKIYFKI